VAFCLLPKVPRDIGRQELPSGGSVNNVSDAKEEHKDAGAPGAKKKPKLLLILAGGLILGGGGFGAFLFLGGGGGAATAEAEDPHAKPDAHGKTDAHGKPDAHGKTDAHGKPEAGGDAHGGGHGDKKDGPKTLAAGNDKRGKTKVVTREPAVVNLRDSKGTRYLKVRIGLEITNDAVAEELKNMDPQLSDFINEKLSTCDITQIDNVAGRNRLRRELLSGINEILQAGVVERIYFTEFVIQ